MWEIVTKSRGEIPIFRHVNLYKKGVLRKGVYELRYVV